MWEDQKQRETKRKCVCRARRYRSDAPIRAVKMQLLTWKPNTVLMNGGLGFCPTGLPFNFYAALPFIPVGSPLLSPSDTSASARQTQRDVPDSLSQHEFYMSCVLMKPESNRREGVFVCLRVCVCACGLCACVATRQCLHFCLFSKCARYEFICFLFYPG